MAEQQSLFGPTADEVQRQMAAEAQQAAFKQAQLNPLQQLTYTGAQAGTAIGGAVANMAGYKDPRIVQAEKAKAIQDALAKRGMDFNKPDEVYNYLADQFAAAGMGEQAIQAKLTGFDVALKGQKTEAEIAELKARAAKEAQLKQTEISRLMGERKAAQDANNPDLVAAIDGQIAKIQHIAPISGTEGTGNPDEKVHVIRDGKDPSKVLATGEVQKTSPPKTTVSVGGPKVIMAGDSGGMTSYLSDVGKQHAALLAKGKDAAQSLGIIENMSKLSDMGVISGPFSKYQLQLSKMLGALGASSADTQKIVGNSEVFNSNATELVMKTLGGKLGGNVSNTDLEFVQNLVPQLEHSPQARKELFNYIKAKLKYEKDTSEEAANYTQKYRIEALKTGKLPDTDPFTGFKPKSFEYNNEQYKTFEKVNKAYDELPDDKKPDESTAAGRAQKAAILESIKKRVGAK